MTDADIIDGIERREEWPEYTNRPADLGGPTKGGITLATLRVWRNNPTLGIDALKALERPEARAIYQFLYIQPFANVPDLSLREYLIDLGVLRGPRAAAMMLQDIVGARPVDGWIGPKTLKALEPLSRHALVMVIGARFAHIEQRVRAVPSQEEFRNGWRNRNRSFLP